MIDLTDVENQVFINSLRSAIKTNNDFIEDKNNQDEIANILAENAVLYKALKNPFTSLATCRGFLKTNIVREELYLSLSFIIP